MKKADCRIGLAVRVRESYPDNFWGYLITEPVKLTRNNYFAEVRSTKGRVRTVALVRLEVKTEQAIANANK